MTLIDTFTTLYELVQLYDMSDLNYLMIFSLRLRWWLIIYIVCLLGAERDLFPYIKVIQRYNDHYCTMYRSISTSNNYVFIFNCLLRFRLNNVLSRIACCPNGFGIVFDTIILIFPNTTVMLSVGLRCYVACFVHQAFTDLLTIFLSWFYLDYLLRTDVTVFFLPSFFSSIWSLMELVRYCFAVCMVCRLLYYVSVMNRLP